MTTSINLVYRLLCPSALALALVLSICVTAGEAAASTAEPGPGWISPQSGTTVPYMNDLVFEVTPVPNADQYLFGFDVNGQPAWENYADERQLSGTRYVLKMGSDGHSALGRNTSGQTIWQVHVGTRAYIRDSSGGYHWSEQSDLNITLDAGSGGNSNQNSAAPAPPSNVTNSFCFGPSLNLIWEDGSDSDSFRVYKNSERVELTPGDGKLRTSGSSYVYEVPGPIQHATLGVSAVRGGVESEIARPRQATFTC
ncbi:MAG: hypothetical protein ACRDRH_21765 [Pseudonocardia sp.]